MVDQRPTRSAPCEIRRSPHQLACEVGDEKVVLQTKSGQYLGMNPVGAFIWDLLATPRLHTELVALVVGRYEVDTQTAQTDVDSFVAELAAAGLVEIEERAS